MQQIEITIDPTRTHQTIIGLGTAYINFGEPPRPEFSDPAFFDLMVDDLGISIVRNVMQGRIQPGPALTPSGDIDFSRVFIDDVGAGWSFARRMNFLQEFKKRGVDRFICSPYSPPAWMKTHRYGPCGGYLRADMLDPYAAYLAANIILAKQNHDIDIGYMSIQNELLFAEPYESCIYNPFLLRETVRAIMDRFEREQIGTRILLPEDMMFHDRMSAYIAPTMADPRTSRFPGGFCTHRQGGRDEVLRWHESTRQYDRENWMTETSGHLQTWDGALKMANDMHDYLAVGNFSAWLYWQITDSAQSAVYALLVDGNPDISPKYHAARQFYRFIRPCAVRIECRAGHPGVAASAWCHHGDETLVFVLINNEPYECGMHLASERSDLPAMLERHVSDADHRCKDVGVVSTSTPLVLPPRSITTLRGKYVSPAGKPDVAEWPVAWIPPPACAGKTWGGHADNPRKMGEPVDSFTPLHVAILRGNLAEVDSLIGGGADICAPDTAGWTPVHMAAATFCEGDHDHPDPVRKYDLFSAVMKSRPDPNIRTGEGFTPLHVAVMNANTGWLQREDDNVRRITDLVTAGAEVNARDDQGRTPLHWAAWQGYNILEISPLIVDALLTLGATPDLKDRQGNTPLDYALRMGYAPVIRSLETAGTRTHITGSTGDTEPGHCGLPITESNPAGDSPKRGSGHHGRELLQAAWHGDQEKVRALLAMDADIHHVDTDGFNAIDRARDNGHDAIVQMILEARNRG